MKPKYKKSRSGYEDRIRANLDQRGIKYGYETRSFTYRKIICKHCGETAVEASYTPDFIFDGGLPLVVEAKGYWDTEDRNKLKLVLRDNPGIDIRFILQRDQAIRKGSKTKYGMILDKLGVPWCTGTEIPWEWIPK